MKIVYICLVLILAGGCANRDKTPSDVNDQNNEIKANGQYQNSNGEITYAEIEMQGTRIDEVDLDESAKDKKGTKKELEDQYGMREASSIKKEWDEQVDYLEDYIERNGVGKIELSEDGKAKNEEIKTGCTISIDGFLKAIEDAKTKIK